MYFQRQNCIVCDELLVTRQWRGFGGVMIASEVTGGVISAGQEAYHRTSGQQQLRFF